MFNVRREYVLGVFKEGRQNQRMKLVDFYRLYYKHKAVGGITE